GRRWGDQVCLQLQPTHSQETCREEVVTLPSRLSRQQVFQYRKQRLHSWRGHSIIPSRAPYFLFLFSITLNQRLQHFCRGLHGERNKPMGDGSKHCLRHLKHCCV
ncbi:unnamed protein product, partial [Ectocarpus sp. 8 AP-2014]